MWSMTPAATLWLIRPWVRSAGECPSLVGVAHAMRRNTEVEVVAVDLF